MPEQPPDITRIFSLIHKLSEGRTLKSDQIHELTELIRTMSGINVIEKIDAQNARLESYTASNNANTASNNAKLESFTTFVKAELKGFEKLMNSKYNTLLWMIGVIGFVLTAGITVIGFLVG